MTVCGDRCLCEPGHAGGRTSLDYMLSSGPCVWGEIDYFQSCRSAGLLETLFEIRSYTMRHFYAYMFLHTILFDDSLWRPTMSTTQTSFLRETFMANEE